MNVQLLIGAVLLSLSFYGGYELKSLFVDRETLKKERTEVKLTEKQAIHADQGAAEVIKYQVSERIRYVYIKDKAKALDRTPFYAAGAPACLDDDGLQLLRDAANERSTPASQSASAVPPIGSPEGR